MGPAYKSISSRATKNYVIQINWIDLGTYLNQNTYIEVIILSGTCGPVWQMFWQQMFECIAGHATNPQLEEPRDRQAWPQSAQSNSALGRLVSATKPCGQFTCLFVFCFLFFKFFIELYRTLNVSRHATPSGNTFPGWAIASCCSN